jgi:hypothetical protein
MGDRKPVTLKNGSIRCDCTIRKKDIFFVRDLTGSNLSFRRLERDWFIHFSFTGLQGCDMRGYFAGDIVNRE